MCAHCDHVMHPKVSACWSLRLNILVCLPEGRSHKRQNENLEINIQKCTWHKSLYLMQLIKCTSLSSSFSPPISPNPNVKIQKEKTEKMKWKHNSKKVRSSNQPPKSSCCAVLRLHNIYKPKETHTTWHCTGSSVCPLCLNLTPNYREADQQHALNIHEKMKVQNRNYYRTCPACRINI